MYNYQEIHDDNCHDGDKRGKESVGNAFVED